MVALAAVVVTYFTVDFFALTPLQKEIKEKQTQLKELAEKMTSLTGTLPELRVLRPGWNTKSAISIRGQRKGGRQRAVAGFSEPTGPGKRSTQAGAQFPDHRQGRGTGKIGKATGPSDSGGSRRAVKVLKFKKEEILNRICPVLMKGSYSTWPKSRNYPCSWKWTRSKSRGVRTAGRRSNCRSVRGF